MSRNPVHHRRTKHIELDIHFVREKVAIGELRVTHVPSARQLADVFTKGLPSALFFDFRDSLSVTAPDVETAGGVSGNSSATAKAAQRALAPAQRALAATPTDSPGLHGAHAPALRARPLACNIRACTGLAKGLDVIYICTCFDQ